MMQRICFVADRIVVVVKLEGGVYFVTVWIVGSEGYFVTVCPAGGFVL